MDILCITGWFPYPPDNGARSRLYHLLRELGSRHRLDLLSFVRLGEEKPDARAFGGPCRLLGVVPFQMSRPSSLRALLGFLSPRPRSLLSTYSATMDALVHRALERRHYDLVLASEIGPGIYTSRYVRDVRSVPRVMEDLELSMIWAEVQAQPTALGRWRHRLTWWKQRRYIRDLLRRMDGCTVVSQRERQMVLDVIPDYCPLGVVPNGVELARYRGDFGSVEPDTLIFPGALTYKANFDAMRFFLSKVFPRIRAARPGVVLRITGRTEGVDLHRLLLDDGVVLTGYLNDVRPAVARSTVCVVPLRVGGGTRLKILEAMALGTPVVSTTKGAEGLEATPGEGILIADTPPAFADAVLRLLDDGSLRARLSANGLRLVAERYGWDRIGRRLEQFLRGVVRTHRTGAMR